MGKKINFFLLCILITNLTITIKLYKTYMSLYGPQHYLPPLSAMVNDTLYIYNSTIDTNSIDIIFTERTGTITNITNEGFATKNEQASFGDPGMEYWLIEPNIQDSDSSDGNLLYVKIDDYIFVLKPLKEVATKASE